jgi:cytochrome c-type biogenesis protein CcmH/NrfF
MATLVLWLTPVVVLVGGGIVAISWTRRRAQPTPVLSDDEEAALTHILRRE